MSSQTFRKHLVEQFGKENVGEMDRVPDVISTGSLALDISTDIGGIPKARFTHIHGPDSSGKTTLALSICKNALKRGDRVLYMDIEQTLDPDLVHTILGEHLTDENFVVMMPELAEDAFIACEYAVNNKEVDVIIFDSIGALLPAKELEDDFGDANVALIARRMTTFLRRNASKVRQAKIAFVFLNQVRAKIGAFVKSYEKPGGNALKHYTSLEIALYKGSFIEEKVDKEKIKIGSNVKFTVRKNKVGIPYREASFPIVWGKGIDYVRDVLDFADLLGVVTSRGPYKSFEGETLELGIARTLEHLRENPEVLDKIVKKCYDVVGVVPIIPVEEGDNGESGEETDG